MDLNIDVDVDIDTTVESAVSVDPGSFWCPCNKSPMSLRSVLESLILGSLGNFPFTKIWVPYS